MRALKKYPIVIFASLLLAGCETVIDIEPEEGDRKYIIESLLSKDSVQTVKVTKSIGFYEEGVPGVTGALVTITDDMGFTYTLASSGTDGVYATSFEPEAGKTYDLHIEADGEVFDASTKMPAFIELEEDRVDFFQDPNSPQFAVIVIRFDDVPGEPTFARVKLFVNGRGDEDDYLLLSDENIDDGEEIQRGFFPPERVETGDTISIVLQAISKETFEYYDLLSSSIRNNSTSGAPFNPQGNITNDALGYFGAAQMDTVHVIVP